jgi:hypothetical protein
MCELPSVYRSLTDILFGKNKSFSSLDKKPFHAPDLKDLESRGRKKGINLAKS